MSIFRKLLSALTVCLLIIIVIGLFLPSRRYMSRSIAVHTPMDVVFNEVNSLKRWKNWSPWQNMDPHTVIQYEGPEAGVGCTMSWASEHPQVGKGTQQIVVSEPHQHIVINLDFVGWDGTLTAGWKFEEKGENETLVTWSNDSDNQGKLLHKYMDLIIHPQLIKAYEQGLKSLKAHVENLRVQQQELQKDENVGPQDSKKTT